MLKKYFFQFDNPMFYERNIFIRPSKKKKIISLFNCIKRKHKNIRREEKELLN